jgi:hypothetical protein
MQLSKTSLADRIAMALGGGLVLLGTAVLGFFETVIGNYHAMPVTNDAGDVVATTTFDPSLRAAIIALGLLVWLGYALYTVFGAISGSGASSGIGAGQAE